MANQPTLQFLIAYWGDPTLFRETLASLQAQSDPGWSAVVVDDCYPDPTIADLLRGGFDERITYLRNESQLGVAGNFERCRTLATADLVCFLGCDDLLEPDFVATAVRLAERHPRADMFQAGVRVVDSAGEPTLPLGDRVKSWLRPGGTRVLGGEPLAVSILHGNWVYWPSLVIRREAVADRSFDPTLATDLDLDLVLRLVLDGASMAVDDHPTFRYRRHEASASSATLLDGSRFAEDRRFFRLARDRFRAAGWHRAAAAATLRLTSRLHGASLLPAALRGRDAAGARALWSHVTEN